MAGGQNGGFFAEFAHLLAAAAASEPAFRLVPLETPGTLQNLQLMRAGRAGIGRALADALGTDLAGLAAVGRVYQTYWQLAVPLGSPIKSVAGLAGRTVSLGPAQSGTRSTALRILAAAGVRGGDFTERPLGIAATGSALVTGTVDAALFAGGVPLPIVAGSAGNKIRLIDLGAKALLLQRQYGSVYQSTSIPAGVYGNAGETRTVGVASLLLARSDLTDVVAGSLVDILVSRSADLVLPEFWGCSFWTRALITTAGVPLHPGAAATYRRWHG
ncbi:TAXI family TRAP transporter solute-binding subunit [Arthrobacter sp. SDTb3-6]|nr:TAXI family TRAP transporter solute-binding subunit [Arthrobacter sp. SDTb3-6]